MYGFENALNVIIKMRAGMCVNSLYMILLKWELVFIWMRLIWTYYNDGWYMSQCAFYNIMKMRAVMCPKWPHMVLLEWELVCVWVRSKWYYENKCWYVSDYALHGIKMRVGMGLNALYMIALIWGFVYFWMRFVILLKWELLCVWMRFICYY